MLHVLDGDATLPSFLAARLPGDVVVWREALLDGPWPRDLRGVDEALEAVARAAKAGEEIVLWFDEDLFCRVHAAYHAAAFPHARFTNAVGSHADRSDLAGLFARRASLRAGLADAWGAYASPDPRALVPLAQEMPWLRLHLERFPHAQDGLSALERRALEVLRDEGPLALPDLHRRVATEEFGPTRYGLGDAMLERALAQLGPLVARGEAVALTEEGRRVLDGRADRAQVAPLDRWVGGVHLTPANDWRWDGERLLAPRPASSRKP